MTDEEKTEKKMLYIHKVAEARGISYQEAYELALTKEYLAYVDKLVEINSR